MKTKLKPILPLLLFGLLATSCEKKEMDEVVTDSTSSTSNATSSSVLFEETVEGSNPFSAAHSTDLAADYSLTFDNSTFFEGAKSARFELRESDPLVSTGKRAEVTIIRGENLPSNNMWYSYAVYFPADYAYDDEPEILNQWFQDRSPATALRAEKDKIYLHTGNEYEPDNRVKIDLGAVNKGSWSTFVFHFIHSHGSDGLVEVWRNGVKVASRNGGNMYDVGIMPKWKIGLYKSAFKYGTSAVDKRVVCYDNIRVGNGTATLANMISPTSISATSSTSTTTTSSPTPETTTTTTTSPTTSTTTSPTTTTTSSTATQKVESFTLINADTDKEIMTIQNGATLELSKLGTAKLNIRANVSPSVVGSVSFALSGAQSKTRSDETAPYSLFGDSSGNFYSWTPASGSYTLKATPYTEDNGNGTGGTALSISFSVK
jgi:hypothetical protein